jgi:hypothetical protein
MSYLTPVWSARRRFKTEETYERIIVSMAREIVNPATTPERRKRCQDSLLNACVMVSAFHGLSASRLYWTAIRKAEDLQEGMKQ